MPRQSPEYELHKAVIEWLAWVKPDCLYFHPYNGAYMSKATAGKGKALGVLAGVADLVFVLKGGRVGFIELKAPKGGTWTPVQKAFRDSVNDLNAPYIIARSIEEVQGTLQSWGVTLDLPAIEKWGLAFAHTRGRAA